MRDLAYRVVALLNSYHNGTEFEEELASIRGEDINPAWELAAKQLYDGFLKTLTIQRLRILPGDGESETP